MKKLLLAIMLVATPAGAGEVADLLMQPGLLEDVPAQDLPKYTHKRVLNTKTPSVDKQSTQAVIRPDQVTDGGVKLSHVTSENAEKLQLALSEGGEYQVVAEFSAGSSNPILLFFLENIVRVTASETGGSPFYIRNRIRDALVTAEPEGEPEGENAGYRQIVLHPFAKDKNAARLGDFADLTITLEYDPEQPYRLFRLLANTGTDKGGYNEAMTLIGEK